MTSQIRSHIEYLNVFQLLFRAAAACVPLDLQHYYMVDCIPVFNVPLIILTLNISTITYISQACFTKKEPRDYICS